MKVNAEIEFLKNDKREVTSLMPYQGGRDSNSMKK